MTEEAPKKVVEKVEKKIVTPKVVISDAPPVVEKEAPRDLPPQTLREMEAGRAVLEKHKK